MRLLKLFCVSIAICAVFTSANLAQVTSKNKKTSSAKISDTEISGGLKEALFKGVKSAVSNLERENGFLGDTRVKISLPNTL